MPYTIGISQISDTSCKRKRLLYIISRKNKHFPKGSFNSKAQAGIVIHFLIQQLLKNRISHLEYLHFRKKKKITECIKLVLLDLLEYVLFLYRIKFNKGIFTKSELNEIKTVIYDEIPTISDTLSSFLIINKDKKKIATKLIDDEFTVAYNLLEDVLLTGKIDIVCFNKQNKELEFIEIKTGSLSRIADPRRQLKLYREIFLESRFKKIISKIVLFLWSTKPGDTAKKYAMISPVKTTRTSELKKIKNELKLAESISKQYELPPILNRTFTKLCNYCEYYDCCDDLTLIIDPVIEVNEK
ncbi:MAG: PD-(D/E)XK nuclease family protein [Candidatus Helarchaeota archaeon]